MANEIVCEVCLEPLKPGERIVSAVAPVDQESTEEPTAFETMDHPGAFHEEHWTQRRGRWHELSRGWGLPEQQNP